MDVPYRSALRKCRAVAWRFAAALCGCLALACQGARGGGEDEGVLGGLVRWVTGGDSQPRDVPPQSARSQPPSARERDLRRQTFEHLVSEIRKHHVFSSAWPEAEWARDLPELEREVLAARGRDALLLAFCHLSNSLRDGHLTFSPCPGAAGPTDRLTLPLAVSVTGNADAPHFIVMRAERASGVAPGDVLLSYDGVASERLVDHFRFELTGGHTGLRIEQLTEILHSRFRFGRQGLEDTHVPVTVRHGAGVVHAEPQFRIADPPVSRPTVAAPSLRCPGPARDYAGAYELVDAGAHLCLYRAARAPFERYPLVRHLSFLYTTEELASDHALVAAFLAQTPAAAGVLLDLRDNGGGIAADHFLRWYTSGEYRGASEWVHLRHELDDRGRLRQALRSDDAVDEYLRRVASGDEWWVRPFNCGGGDCKRVRDRGLGRVTAAPIALLLGPGCRSACDTFAAIWTRESFGPTVGKPPAAMYTSLRYPLEVKLGDEPLGDFNIALCGLRFSDSEPWLEGRPLLLDSLVEARWPADEGELLRAAVQALGRQSGASPTAGARK